MVYSSAFFVKEMFPNELSSSQIFYSDWIYTVKWNSDGCVLFVIVI